MITDSQQTAQSEAHPVIISDFQSIIPRSDRTTTLNDKANQVHNRLGKNQHVLSKRSMGYYKLGSKKDTINNILVPEKTGKFSSDTKFEMSPSPRTPSKKSNRHLSECEAKESKSRSLTFLNWLSFSQLSPSKQPNRALADFDPKGRRSQSLEIESEGPINLFRPPKLTNSNEKPKVIQSESVQRATKKSLGAQTQTIGGGSLYSKSFSWPSTSTCGIDNLDLVHSPTPSNKNGKNVFFDGNRSVRAKNDIRSMAHQEIAHAEGQTYRRSRSASEIVMSKPSVRGSPVRGKNGKPKNAYKIPGRPTLLVIDENKQT
ncbi:uncharacterized protein MELLADRAFT_109659 [Melampsora larici-populina 98AG31]|uniref:Uncharacterized protein n=1 Tax=Melampsora larici-populina (strain 98AG31 / pathotype 3-4-7) TaxID=747676 RepID=F4RX78_MELLP|nr:uncharacterized protein MELLADRAFT_109659 [Melampsora larici-populina 98AG31]EGG02921.1 hypothetical protein MELLADRAFT_109659 [Melampsora larici-populina 98AG31]